ncbi:MAG: ankyrin repeat domain-containing protein [Calothrix sp. FI2-JRJ7]|nr:ankyrin repeat domain-containing protein [Calothrix sp. FI2-JRJ7]
MFGLNFDNKIEIPKFLIENGADVNAKTNDGETPLDLALRGYNSNLIKLFKQKGGKQNRS